jgi:hypothetical protein
MKFNIRRVSGGSEQRVAPVEHPTLKQEAVRQDWEDEEDFERRWTVEVDSLEDVMKLHTRVVIFAAGEHWAGIEDLPTIEVYDRYRE